MPLYYFKCLECNLPEKRLLSVAESKQDRHCKCGGKLKRTPKPPSSQATEILDNGIMTKKIERLVDAERLNREQYDAQNKHKE